ncbi:unnamed protein product [Rotaria sp. Silwood2]|nr:unnamed protein product [Rotaria sp. Silwood2]
MSSTGYCFGSDTATRQSIQEFEKRQKKFAHDHDILLDQMDYLSDRDLLQAFDVYCSKETVADNGVLMCLAPVPLFFFRCPEVAVEYSGISGQITHGDEKAYDACRYYGALIVAAILGEDKDQLISNTFYDNHREWFGDKTLHPEIMTIAQGSYKKEGGYQDGIRGKEYVVNSLEAALWAFWSDKNSFRIGALKAVNLSDDTDTTAAIYGQLAGAYYGYRKTNKFYSSQFAHFEIDYVEHSQARIAAKLQDLTVKDIMPNILVRKAIDPNGRIGHFYDGWQDRILLFQGINLDMREDYSCPPIKCEIKSGDKLENQNLLQFIDFPTDL